MTTQIRAIDAHTDYWGSVREAASCLVAGGLVVLPTETVYGLAANAFSAEAMSRLRHLKNRQENKPFTLHIGSPATVDRFVPDLGGLGRRLITKAWPGPLTIVFPVNEPEKAPVIQENSPEHIATLYHEGTIGIRCPQSRVTADILNEAGVPIVAASANPADAPAPSTAELGLRMLDGKVDLVIDDGETQYREASSVIRVDGNRYTMLREGVLKERTIRKLATLNFLMVCTGNTCRSPMAEVLLRRLLAKRIGCEDNQLSDHGYHVESAGVAGSEGLPASETAIAAMRSRGIDLSSHRSAPLTRETIDRADHIFVMTTGHLAAVTSMCPSAQERCRLLNDRDIEDPIGGDEQTYARCAKRIDEALRRHGEEILL